MSDTITRPLFSIADLFTGTTEAVEFHYHHAGFSYDPSVESKGAGHRRCAYEAAAAEAWAESAGIVVEWADDWDGDHSYTNAEVTTCEHAAALDSDGTVLASVGCVDDATDDYRRVVAAELYLEAFETLSR